MITIYVAFSRFCGPSFVRPRCKPYVVIYISVCVPQSGRRGRRGDMCCHGVTMRVYITSNGLSWKLQEMVSKLKLVTYTGTYFRNRAIPMVTILHPLVRSLGATYMAAYAVCSHHAVFARSTPRYQSCACFYRLLRGFYNFLQSLKSPGNFRHRGAVARLIVVAKGLFPCAIQGFYLWTLLLRTRYVHPSSLRSAGRFHHKISLMKELQPASGLRSSNPDFVSLL